MLFILLGWWRSCFEEEELEVHAEIALMFLYKLLCEFMHLIVYEPVACQLKQNDCPAFNKQVINVIV